MPPKPALCPEVIKLANNLGYIINAPGGDCSKDQGVKVTGGGSNQIVIELHWEPTTAPFLSGNINDPIWNDLVDLKIIKMKNQNLNGNLPSFITSNSMLTTVELQGNQITGKILSFPSALVTGDFSDNLFSGTIPSLPTSLTTLNVANNLFNGSIPTFPTALTSFNSKENALTGILPSFNSVRDLDVSFNKLSGAVPAVPSGFIMLKLQSNQFTSVGSLGTVMTTTTCDISNNQFYAWSATSWSGKCLMNNLLASTLKSTTGLMTTTGMMTTTGIMTTPGLMTTTALMTTIGLSTKGSTVLGNTQSSSSGPYTVTQTIKLTSGSSGVSTSKTLMNILSSGISTLKTSTSLLSSGQFKENTVLSSFQLLSSSTTSAVNLTQTLQPTSRAAASSNTTGTLILIPSLTSSSVLLHPGLSNNSITSENLELSSAFDSLSANTDSIISTTEQPLITHIAKVSEESSLMSSIFIIVVIIVVLILAAICIVMVLRRKKTKNTDTRSFFSKTTRLDLKDAWNTFMPDQTRRPSKATMMSTASVR